MIRLFTVVLIVLASSLANGASVTDSARKERALARRAEHLVSLGGLVEKPYSGAHIEIVLATRRIVPGDVNSLAADIHRFTALPFRVSGVPEERWTDPIALARGTLAGAQAGSVVVIGEDDKFPTLLAAPEEGWSFINMARLADENPTSEVLAKRMKKELWRAVAYGVGMKSQMQPCALQIVKNVADLDHMVIEMCSPEAQNRMLAAAADRSIRPAYRANYKKACMEGWAPAPTNDIQKAIFERVKADKERGPSKPLTIAPPAKK